MVPDASKQKNLLVIEAVPERIELKLNIFRDLSYVILLLIDRLTDKKQI